MRKQQRLEREHARLLDRNRQVAERVERLRREVQNGAEQAYLRTKATHALLHGGAGYLAARDARYRRTPPSGTRAPVQK